MPVQGPRSPVTPVQYGHHKWRLYQVYQDLNPDPNLHHGPRAAVTKSELAAGHGRNKVAMQFKLRVFVRGHTPTDYKRLFETDEHYQVGAKGLLWVVV